MSIGPWDFTGFDIVVLVVLLISLLMAAGRGLFRELISIAALIVAMIASLFVWGRFRFTAQDLIRPGWLADAALGLGTFGLAYLLITFILNGATKPLRGNDVGLVDRLLGGGFGVLRGFIVMSLIVMVTTASYRESKEMEDYAEGLSSEERAALQNAPPAIRDMISGSKGAKLPPIYNGSTFYPILDTIGGAIRALPITRFKTMAEKLKDGDDVSDILKEFEE